MQPGSSPLVFTQSFCSVNEPGCELEPFAGKFSLFFFSLSGNLTVWVAISHYPLQIVLRAFRPSPYTKDR